MLFFKWLTKSLIALSMIGMLSACNTTPATEGGAAETAPANVDPKQAKNDTLNKIDKALEEVFNESSGLF